MEERRGRPATTVQEEPPRKYTKTYEDESTTETWIFDLDKFSRGPISVEIKYKDGADKQKNWNKISKQSRDDKRNARQMKKINERNK
jgi:hypothetical protein